MDAAARERLLGIGSPPLAGRTRFLPETDRTAIDGVRRGVVFVMAFWSGPSVRMFAELKRVLSEHDPDGRLEVVVADIDACPDLQAHPAFGGPLGGAGETLWIADGQVTATSGRGFNPSCIEPFTRQLLGEVSTSPGSPAA